MKGNLPDRWQKAENKQGMLPVDQLHEIHWRTYGNHEFTPVLFLHGGPGSGADVSHLLFFDPDKHYVIFFDQRGTGQSIPKANITDNTTVHLIQDIEQLRLYLGIERWIVFGGSWGATLGLVYAQTHPSPCVALVLRGFSNSHEFQNRWVLETRAMQMPERHHAFIRNLTRDERKNPVRAHLDNILSENLTRQRQAMTAVSALETGLSDATAKPFTQEYFDLEVHASVNEDELSRATIYLHYWENRKFLDDRECLPNPSALNNIPIHFVHGKSDWICPLAGVRAICRILSHATLIEVPQAGHSPMNKDMKDQLCRLMDSF